MPSVIQVFVGAIVGLGLGTLVVSVVRTCMARTANGERDEEQDRLIRAAQVRARDEQIAQNREHQAVRNRRLQKVNQQQLQETLRRLGVEGTSPAHRGYTLGDGSTNSTRSLSPSRAVQQVESRRLREEQDRNYEEALEKDRIRVSAKPMLFFMNHAHQHDEKAEQNALKIANEKIKEQQEIEEAQRLSMLISSIPPEPEADSPNLSTLSLRWPDGSSVTRRFNATETIQTILAFAESQDRLPRGKPICLVTSYPRQTLHDVNATLQELSLIPNAVLFVDIA